MSREIYRLLSSLSFFYIICLKCLNQERYLHPWVGELHFLHGTMTSTDYTDILSQHMPASAKKGWLFQQDNHLKRKSAVALRCGLLWKTYMRSTGLRRVLTWTQLSTYGVILKKKVMRRSVQKHTRFGRGVLSLWSQIVPQVREKLVSSMSKLWQAVKA